MRRQQGRITRQGAARHSETLSRGASGDPRDHRREAQRLTDQDLDPATLKIVNGRLTVLGNKTNVASVPAVVDQTSGTPSSIVPEVRDLAAAPATASDLRDELVTVTLPAIRNALSTLASTVNAILAEAKAR